MRKLLALLRLYRADAAAISFLSYAAGVVLTRTPSIRDVVIGALISLVSFNFIYSFNSWSDRHIDALNKPGRPLPAGQIAPRLALGYSLFLGAAAFVYPFFVIPPGAALAALLFLPVLGLLYSAKPVRLRRFRVVSVLMIGLMYVSPMVIALLGFSGSLGATHAMLVAYFFLFGVAIIPLKDIGDRAGDAIDRSANWEDRIGARGLQKYSLLSIGVAGLIFTFVSVPLSLKASVLCVSGVVAAVILFQLVSGRDPRPLYRRVLVAIIISGAVAIPFWSWWFGNGDSDRFSTGALPVGLTEELVP